MSCTHFVFVYIQLIWLIYCVILYPINQSINQFPLNIMFAWILKEKLFLICDQYGHIKPREQISPPQGYYRVSHSVRTFFSHCMPRRTEGRRGGGLNLHFLNSLNSNLCQYFSSSYVDNICLWFLIKMPHDNPPPHLKEEKNTPMGHIAHLRNQFKLMNTFEQSYDII